MNRTLYRIRFIGLCTFVIAADDLAQARMFYRTRMVGDRPYWQGTRQEVLDKMASSETENWEITILGTALDSTETYVI